MLESSRKADDVAEDLLGRIVHGEIPVGSLLPREADLAEQYGVGRSVVREANKLLEVHRLVEPRRRRGTEVLDPLASLTPKVIGAMLVARDGRIDRAMLAELLEIRALLDAELAGLAAERRTAADLANIERCLQRLATTAADSDAGRDALDDFGLALAHASGNRLFVMLSHWHRQITRGLGALLTPVRARVAELDGHRLLVQAIRNRDGQLARELVRQFHTWANREILRQCKGK